MLGWLCVCQDGSMPCIHLVTALWLEATSFTALTSRDSSSYRKSKPKQRQDGVNSLLVDQLIVSYFDVVDV